MWEFPQDPRRAAGRVLLESYARLDGAAAAALASTQPNRSVNHVRALEMADQEEPLSDAQVGELIKLVRTVPGYRGLDTLKTLAEQLGERNAAHGRQLATAAIGRAPAPAGAQPALPHRRSRRAAGTVRSRRERAGLAGRSR